MDKIIVGQAECFVLIINTILFMGQLVQNKLDHALTNGNLKMEVYASEFALAGVVPVLGRRNTFPLTKQSIEIRQIRETRI